MGESAKIRAIWTMAISPNALLEDHLFQRVRDD
jgi:hypothetical protein